MGDPRQDLHQGVFAFGIPLSLRGWIAMGIGALMLVIAVPTFLLAGTLVDAPPPGEVPLVSDPGGEQPDDAPTVLREGRQGAAGHWVRTTAKTTENYAEITCTTNEDGEESWSLYVLNDRSEFLLPNGDRLVLTNPSAPHGYPTPGCQDYTIRANEDVQLLVFVNHESGEEEVLGVGVRDERAQRPLGRMTAFTTSFGTLAIACLVLMGATSPPGAGMLKKLQRAHDPHPRLHQDAEGLRYAVAPEWSGDQHDWVFDPPGVEAWNRTMPYAADNPEALLPEHPNNLGKLHLATFTMYSVWGLGFVAAVSMLGIYSDRAYGLIGRLIMQGSLALFSGLVFWASWGRWKRLHSIIDTPTSPIRSVAVGMAEVVGEVRPAATGSMRVTVGTQSVPGSSTAITALTSGIGKAAIKSMTGQHLQQHTVDGVVAYKWLQEVWETRGSGDDKVTKWWHEAEDQGSTPFLIHDGTGGLHVDPETWLNRSWSSASQGKGSRMASLFGGGRSTFNFGPAIFDWQVGNIVSIGSMTGINRPRRWTMHCLRIGDPVYALGRVQPRTSEALAAEGLDGSVPSSNLTMVGEDDVGISASMHRGTELSVMCSVRSTTEAIITPALMVIAAVLPILM
ncbi:MAG: hypothetical protein CMA08_00905 [Euryarchaeota archaeon]|nr:hypothetical protein [Euryarchaeota archaeon]OUX23056.1 MAG: hypothetical protein CBE12_00815 [Euryarchaeota archaeon TMED252]